MSQYPAFTEPPTGAVEIENGTAYPVNPNTLCTYTPDNTSLNDAQWIVDQFRALYPPSQAVIVERIASAFPVVYPPTEDREQWGLFIGTQYMGYVEAWLRAAWQPNGIGAPGKWVLQPPPGDPFAGPIPNWIPAPLPPPPPPPPAIVTQAQIINLVAAYNAQGGQQVILAWGPAMPITGPVMP